MKTQIALLLLITSFCRAEPTSGVVVEISDVRGVEDKFGGTVVTGRATNKTKTTLKNISIRYDFFASNGDKIGDAKDYVSTLDTGETWSFKIVCFDKRGETYALADVRCSHGRVLFEDITDKKKAEQEKLEKEAEARKQEERRLIAAKLAQERAEAQRKKAKEAQEKTHNFYVEQSKAGRGYYQLRLAEKYSRGEGVPKDLSAARFWANAALTNGEWAATNILSTISTTTNSLKDIK